MHTRQLYLPLSIFFLWMLFFMQVSAAIIALGFVFTVGGAWFLRRIFAGSSWLTSTPSDVSGFRRPESKLPSSPRYRYTKYIKSILFMLLFIPVFIYKVLASGLDIARLALAPSMDFWPGIVRIKGGLSSPGHTTLLAYFITLTPGTLTLDYDEQGDDLYVHWIDVTGYGEDGMDERVIGELRRWVGRLLG